MGNYRKAIEIYSSEISLNPKSASGYNKRGFCKAKLNEFDQAVEDYNKSLELEPTNTHALHNRGICFQKIGRYNEVRTEEKIRKNEKKSKNLNLAKSIFRQSATSPRS